MAIQCLIEVNRREAQMAAKDRIVKKSHELSLKANIKMTLNAKCMLCVENLKLQLQILKIAFEDRQTARKEMEERQLAKNQAMEAGLRVHAQEWQPCAPQCPQGQVYHQEPFHQEWQYHCGPWGLGQASL